MFHIISLKLLICPDFCDAFYAGLNIGACPIAPGK